ncbi:tyrosine-type recombinase/integrase [Vibrio sp. YMD68]|uniref:tyrosine-type recombinase/integrase n=1 Tax=Vibrio sp. YMD68 TaxID=3042300 RepID=UPI00249B9434|nr:tyrosine-type recombinase/integrase [Vibrio sp. YMD68]WGW01757.1 tyrosine-type recombinase/integrase [Vibrio sp. YMD68]
MVSRTLNRLNALLIKNLKPKVKGYRVADGGGLYLHIKPGGHKTWELRYVSARTGKPTYMGLGSLRLVTLAKARAKALELNKQVRNGGDLQSLKTEKKYLRDKENEMTFYSVANLWRRSKEKRLNPKTVHGNWRKLELYAFPAIGQVPVTKLTAPEAIAPLRSLESLGRLETVKRTAQLMNEIMNYAVNYGLVKANPLVAIRDVFQKPVVTHMKAIKPEEIAELIHKVAIANIQVTTRCLIMWQLHTMTRPGESAGAQWDEIDFEHMVWVIPPSRMNMIHQHEVPLTEQTLAILDAIKPISGHSDYIFPSTRDPKHHTNSETINRALVKMGFKGRITSHGLRSLASTTLNEQGFDLDVIEAALAHQQSNKIRSAYNQTTYFYKRREIMKWWSNHIDKQSYGSLFTGGVNDK